MYKVLKMEPFWGGVMGCTVVASGLRYGEAEDLAQQLTSDDDTCNYNSNPTHYDAVPE